MIVLYRTCSCLAFGGAGALAALGRPLDGLALVAVALTLMALEVRTNGG